MNKMDVKRFAAILCGAALAGSLAGCGPATEARNAGPALTADRECAVTAENTEGGAALLECGGQEPDLFRPYEPFGLRYDAEKDELWFDGELVRWFEDYYPLPGSGGQAGCDFFNEAGTVDVRALRDRSKCVRNRDGSYDPSGTLTGVEAFSQEDFAARDIEAIRNPRPVTATTGGAEPSPEEQAAMEAEYAPFGLTYDAGEGQWYYQGEAVAYLRDVLTSNGKSLSGGGFQGVMRTLPGEKGTLRLETVRDYGRPNAQGYGTLTGVRALGETE